MTPIPNHVESPATTVKTRGFKVGVIPRHLDPLDLALGFVLGLEVAVLWWLL